MLFAVNTNKNQIALSDIVVTTRHTRHTRHITQFSLNSQLDEPLLLPILAPICAHCSTFMDILGTSPPAMLQDEVMLQDEIIPPYAEDTDYEVVPGNSGTKPGLQRHMNRAIL